MENCEIFGYLLTSWDTSCQATLKKDCLAFLTYRDAIRIYGRQDIKNIILHIKKAFDMANVARKLKSIKQLREESVDDYYYRLLKVAGMPTPDSESYIREQFLEGLPRAVSKSLLADTDCGLTELLNKARLVHDSLMAEQGSNQMHAVRTYVRQYVRTYVRSNHSESWSSG